MARKNIIGPPERKVLFLDALQPFDNMANGPCDGCQRQTFCMVFQIQCHAGGLPERHNIRLCIECLIDYAKRASKLVRGHDSISDLV